MKRSASEAECADPDPKRRGMPLVVKIGDQDVFFNIESETATIAQVIDSLRRRNILPPTGGAFTASTASGAVLGGDYAVKTLPCGSVIRIEPAPEDSSDDVWLKIVSWFDERSTPKGFKNGFKIFAAAAYDPRMAPATSAASQFSHRRYMGLRDKLDEWLAIAESKSSAGDEMPDPDIVQYYLGRLLKKAERGTGRFRKNAEFREEHPNVHAVAMYLLWAWLPTFLSGVYSVRAGKLLNEEVFPEAAEERSTEFEERSNAFDFVHESSFEALMDAVPHGFSAMRRALEEVTDDVP